LDEPFHDPRSAPLETEVTHREVKQFIVRSGKPADDAICRTCAERRSLVGVAAVGVENFRLLAPAEVPTETEWCDARSSLEGRRKRGAASELAIP
jgi:hypothetical protein